MSLRSLLRPLALAALLLPAAAQAQQVYISTPVQLYAGPDASYPILFTLFPGMGLEVAGCLPGYQWCDVILLDGQRGWVYGGGLSYSWMGEALPVPQYGASIGIPLITFIIGDYWGPPLPQPALVQRAAPLAPPAIAPDAATTCDTTAFSGASGRLESALPATPRARRA